MTDFIRSTGTALLNRGASSDALGLRSSPERASRVLLLRIVCLAILFSGSSGCTVLVNVARTVFGEAHYQVTDCGVRSKIHKVAKEKWKAYALACPDVANDKDYERGFRDGFSAHVISGDVEPPPLPPSRYLASDYVSVYGAQAMQDWFNGYRAGILAAEQSGYRHLLELPSSFVGATETVSAWETPSPPPEVPPAPAAAKNEPPKTIPKEPTVPKELTVPKEPTAAGEEPGRIPVESAAAKIRRTQAPPETAAAPRRKTLAKPIAIPRQWNEPIERASHSEKPLPEFPVRPIPDLTEFEEN